LLIREFFGCLDLAGETVDRYHRVADGEGRWVEDGLLQSATFIDNLGTLAQFVAASEKEEIPDSWRF
jgi:hypothetical protein